jgi:hypothetical protein
MDIGQNPGRPANRLYFGTPKQRNCRVMMDATHVGATLLADRPDPALRRSTPAGFFSMRSRSSSPPTLVDLLRTRVLGQDAEYADHGPGLGTTVLAEPAVGRTATNYLFAAEDEPHEPDELFRALRWGGQFAYASRSAGRVSELAAKLVRRGFVVERGPAFVRRPVLGVAWPLLSPKVHYVVVRKVQLTLPKEISERFTYHVYLSFDAGLGRHVVVKEVPSVERVSTRLRHKFPDAADDLIEKRARKFTDKVFPIFLTREAAMLKLLARDLPPAYRDRVPHVVDLEKDGRGFVRRMRMSWLRNTPPAGRPLSQLEFARQSADLLRVVHDSASIIHLDLRLDNMVVTDRGVGFVDFGSAVRLGENIQGNPLLNTIFDELMRTSQIQRMLEKMTGEGTVTSKTLNEAYGKVDKGVDLFYLALQINKPLSNPDFRGLVKFDYDSDQAVRLGVLTEEVLKPKDPAHPTIRTAADFLEGVERVAAELGAPAA